MADNFMVDFTINPFYYTLLLGVFVLTQTVIQERFS